MAEENAGKKEWRPMHERGRRVVFINGVVAFIVASLLMLMNHAPDTRL